MSVLAWLVLDATPSPNPIVDKSRVEPGWIALVFLVVLGGAISFLWFSMRKQLGRIDVGRPLRERGSAPPTGNASPPPAGGTVPPANGSAAPPPAPRDI